MQLDLQTTNGTLCIQLKHNLENLWIHRKDGGTHPDPHEDVTG